MFICVDLFPHAYYWSCPFIGCEWKFFVDELQNLFVIMTLKNVFVKACSPPCEADSLSLAATDPSILQNLRAHCRVHKIPPLITILNQINPVHTVTPPLRFTLILSLVYV